MASSRTAYDALCEINDNTIKLNKIDRQKSNLIIKWLTSEVVNTLKKNDELFNALFCQIYYSGSYYDGLKIREPDEFDLNFVLSTSKFGDILTLEEGSPGYFKIRFQKLVDLIRYGTRIADRFLEEFIEPSKDYYGREAYYIIPNKVRKWFATLFETAKNDIPMRIADGSKITKLSTEQNGPAFTLKLEIDNVQNVDIDLAVVFPIPTINFQRIPEIWKNIESLRHSKQDAFLVPISAEKYGPEWSLHFPRVEKEIILNKRCAKPVIRFLKQFRDTNKQLVNLKSYVLKTVVMTMIRDHPEYGWEIGSEPHYFLLALEELKRSLEDRRINWMFHNQSNILRTNKSESMLQFVSTAFSCMNADQTYETWIKYFGMVSSPKPAVNTSKSAPPQFTVATKPIEPPIYIYDYDTYNGSTNNFLLPVLSFMSFTVMTFIFVKVLECFYNFLIDPYFTNQDDPIFIFSQTYLNTSETRLLISIGLSSMVILICTCLHFMSMLIASICNCVIYLISLLLSTFEFMILEFVELLSIVLSIPLFLISQCINLILFILSIPIFFICEMLNFIFEFLKILCEFSFVLCFTTIFVYFQNQNIDSKESVE